MNMVDLRGRIANDLEVRTTNSGKKVCNVSLAVTRNYENANGERDTDFFNMSFWEEQADRVVKNYAKGDMVNVSGSLRMEKRDIDGKKVNMMTIIPREVRLFSRSKNNQEKIQNERNQER